MNKDALEEFIWQTRRDFLTYMTEKSWTARSVEEAHMANRLAFKNINKLGIQTETEYKLVKENAELKEEIELLNETIKRLKNKINHANFTKT